MIRCTALDFDRYNGLIPLMKFIDPDIFLFKDETKNQRKFYWVSSLADDKYVEFRIVLRPFFRPYYKSNLFFVYFHLSLRVTRLLFLSYRKSFSM